MAVLLTIIYLKAGLG